LFAAILGYFVFSEKLPARAIAGLLIGFAGIGLLLRPGSGLDVFGVCMIVGAQIAWAAGAELSSRVGLSEEPRVAAGTELLAGGLVLLVAALLLGDWSRLDLSAVSAVSWAGYLWFIVIAVGGFTAFGYLTQSVAPSIATTFSYVNPIVAMTLGWLLYSEPVSWRMILAVVVIIVGVCLIVSTKSEAPARARHPMTSGHGHTRREGESYKNALT
jgi:drug/metabolite transporter (DMT)-like permease